MATPLQLNTGRGADGTPLVTAVGEIDLSNIDEFTAALISAAGVTGGAMTIDLGAVKYLDSAGINALFDHAEQGGRLRIIVHPLLVRVLAISGLSKIATVESAAQ